MRLTVNAHCLRMSIATGILAVAIAGCSTGKGGNFPAPGDPPIAAAQANAKPAGPPPDIHDCGVVSIGSPSKYVCNGKVYTTFQLAKMKKQYESQQQSGK